MCISFKEAGDARYIYQNQLNKACFQRDMAYGDFKIYQEEQLLIKYYVIEPLILLKSQNTMENILKHISCKGKCKIWW